MTAEDWSWDRRARIYQVGSACFVVTSIEGQHVISGEGAGELLMALISGDPPTTEIEILRNLGLVLPRSNRHAYPHEDIVREEDARLVVAYDGNPEIIRTALSMAPEALSRIVPAFFDGRVLRVGPVADVQGGCWECAEARRLSNAADKRAIAALRHAPIIMPSVIERNLVDPHLDAFLSRLDEDPVGMAGIEWEIDVRSGNRDEAFVPAVPGCALCRRERKVLS